MFQASRQMFQGLDSEYERDFPCISAYAVGVPDCCRYCHMAVLYARDAAATGRSCIPIIFIPSFIHSISPPFVFYIKIGIYFHLLINPIPFMTYPNLSKQLTSLSPLVPLLLFGSLPPSTGPVPKVMAMSSSSFSEPVL